MEQIDPPYADTPDYGTQAAERLKAEFYAAAQSREPATLELHPVNKNNWTTYSMLFADWFVDQILCRTEFNKAFQAFSAMMLAGEVQLAEAAYRRLLADMCDQYIKDHEDEVIEILRGGNDE